MVDPYKKFERMFYGIDTEVEYTVDIITKKLNSYIKDLEIEDAKIIFFADNDRYLSTKIVGKKKRTKREIEAEEKRIKLQQIADAEAKERLELEERKLYAKLKEKYEKSN